MSCLSSALAAVISSPSRLALSRSHYPGTILPLWRRRSPRERRSAPVTPRRRWRIWIAKKVIRLARSFIALRIFGRSIARSGFTRSHFRPGRFAENPGAGWREASFSRRNPAKAPTREQESSQTPAKSADVEQPGGDRVNHDPGRNLREQEGWPLVRRACRENTHDKRHCAHRGDDSQNSVEREGHRERGAA